MVELPAFTEAVIDCCFVELVLVVAVVELAVMKRLFTLDCMGVGIPDCPTDCGLLVVVGVDVG